MQVLFKYTSAVETRFDGAQDLNPQKKSKQFIYLTIKPDQGGEEARDFCSIMCRMIEKHCMQEKYEYDVISQTDYEIILRLEGAYKTWKWLNGYHKIVRVSPFGRGDKVHTSLCRILVSNPEKKLDIKIQDKDIREDFFKSTGPGGQHRNKSMTAVRLTHIPTNTVTVSCAERSQYNNRTYAMEQLLDKLQHLENKLQQLSQEEKRVRSIANKQTILTFYYNHKMVVNESSGIKTTKLKEVLNGGLNLVM